MNANSCKIGPLSDPPSNSSSSAAALIWFGLCWILGSLQILGDRFGKLDLLRPFVLFKDATLFFRRPAGKLL